MSAEPIAVPEPCADGRPHGLWTGIILLFPALLITDAGAVLEQPRFEGTIIVSIISGHTRLAGYDRLIAAYQRHQPGVEVKLEFKGEAFGGMGGYPTWLNTQLASGDPRPDIVSGVFSPTYSGYVNFDYYRHCVNPYTGNPWEEDIDFDFYAFRNNLGQRMLLASQAVHIQWFYNKDLFEQHGLDPPKTWSQFMGVCARLKEAGVVPTTLRFDFRYWHWLANILWDQYSRPYFRYIRAQPGDWCFDPSVDGPWEYDPTDPFDDARATVNQMRLYKAIYEGRIRFDTPQYHRFLQSLKEIVQYTPSDFLHETAGAAYNMFLRQEAAIHLDATWLLPTIEEDMEELAAETRKAGRGSSPLRPFAWGTFDPPSQVNEFVAAPARSVESAAGEYISVIDKSQQQTDMVLDFVMFWLSPPGFQAYVDGQVAANELRPTGRIMVRDIRIPERFERHARSYDMIGNAETPTNSIFGVAPAGSRLRQDARQTLVEFIQDRISVEEAGRRLQSLAQKGVIESLERNNLPLSLLEYPEVDPRSYQ